MSEKREACPCGRVSPTTGRALDYERCCAPLHRGEREAQGAEALMRSRYAAFARGEHAYLRRTLHPDHEDHAEPEARYLASLVATTQRLRFVELRVLDALEAERDGLAEVLFLARVVERRGGRDVSFVERSVFAHDGVGWRYLYGEPTPLRELGPRALELRLDRPARG